MKEVPTLNLCLSSAVCNIILYQTVLWWLLILPTQRASISWWRHQMETFSALLAICAGNSPATGEVPTQRPVTRSLMFSLIGVWINGWVNDGEAGDLRRHRTHYDVIAMWAGVCSFMSSESDTSFTSVVAILYTLSRYVSPHLTAYRLFHKKRYLPRGHLTWISRFYWL